MNLFREYRINDVLNQRMLEIHAYVEQLSNDVIMGNDMRILCDNIYERFKILPVEIQDEDLARREFVQAKVEKWLSAIESWDGPKTIVVDGAILRCYFPYCGNRELFYCSGSTCELSTYPDVIVEDSFICFEYKYDIRDVNREGWKENVEQSLSKHLRDIKRGLSYVNNDVKIFDGALKDQITSMLRTKKEKIEIFYKAAKLIDVSVEKNEYGKNYLSVVRRIVPIAQKFTQLETTYCITDKNYAEIMEVIKHTTATMERTPYSYRFMEEEDLRNVLLASLNGLYQGTATGEAFRHVGKTDICIEEKNRAAFVAECKMWTGEKEVEAGLQQLDSYLTWRDSKTALIYFVRRKNFYAVLDKIKSRLECVQSISRIHELEKNEIECFMASNSTPGQCKVVRVLLVNMYYCEKV